MTEIWAEKYRPNKISHVLGQPDAVRTLVSWANGWKHGKPPKKAVLVHGPTGTGKSAALGALANEFGWDTVEMNASDRRTMSEVKRVAGAAATTGTIFGRGTLRLIVIDDADRIHGTLDRGGYQALLEMIRGTGNPIALVANDPGELPWELRAACLPVAFRKPDIETVSAVLQRICREEGVSAEPEAIRVIAETSRGDIRAAINDLQTAASGKKTLRTGDFIIYRRDVARNVSEFLIGLVSATGSKEARELIWSLDMFPEDALGWISENVPRMLTDKRRLAGVYDAISRADVFLGRTRKSQNYMFWGYASDMMTAGVFSRMGGSAMRLPKFETPSHIRRFSRTRADRAAVASLSKKIAAECHTSSRVVMRDVLPYMRWINRKNRGAGKAIEDWLKLTEVEAKALLQT